MWFMALVSMLCAIDVALIAVAASTANSRHETQFERPENAVSAHVAGLQDVSNYRF